MRLWTLSVASLLCISLSEEHLWKRPSRSFDLAQMICLINAVLPTQRECCTGDVQ